MQTPVPTQEKPANRSQDHAAVAGLQMPQHSSAQALELMRRNLGHSMPSVIDRLKSKG